MEDVAPVKESTRFTSGSVPSLIHDGSAGITRALHNRSLFDFFDGRNIEADDELELKRRTSILKRNRIPGKAKQRSRSSNDAYILMVHSPHLW